MMDKTFPVKKLGLHDFYWIFFTPHAMALMDQTKSAVGPIETIENRALSSGGGGGIRAEEALHDRFGARLTRGESEGQGQD